MSVAHADPSGNVYGYTALEVCSDGLLCTGAGVLDFCDDLFLEGVVQTDFVFTYGAGVEPFV